MAKSFVSTVCSDVLQLIILELNINMNLSSFTSVVLIISQFLTFSGSPLPLPHQPAITDVRTEKRAGLERDASRVDVLDELPEHVRLELLDDQRLVGVTLRLQDKDFFSFTVT